MPPVVSSRLHGLRASDAAWALAYLSLVVVLAAVPLGRSGLLAQPSPAHRWWWTAALIVAAGATVLRSRRPGAVLVVTGTIALADVLLGGDMAAYVLLFEALWTPVALGTRRLARVATALGVLGGAGILAAVLTAVPDGDGLVLGLLVVVTVVATPLMWGWDVRHHRQARMNAEALARAESELASERAARAVEMERRRIAQDLHDVVAGHLSAVTLHTSLADSLPEGGARSASLTTARSSATAALRDLRSVISVLSRGDGSDVLGSPALTMAGLAERLDVGPGTAQVLIDPRTENPDAVDPAVHAALLRITAESVGNALTHGLPPYRLSTAVDGAQVSMTCTNALRPGHRGGQDDGRGLGLAAIADRARAVGGRASAGPHDGQWVVRAALPRRPETALGGTEEERS